MLDFNADMNDLHQKFTTLYKDTSLKVKIEIWWEKSEKVIYWAGDIINWIQM